MSDENQAIEKKSLRLIKGKTSDFDKIATECVGFANARGGHLFIGIEDGENLPPVGQRIESNLVERVSKHIPQITRNVALDARIVTAANGGEYIAIEIFPTPNIAAMSNGRYFQRVGDECRSLMPEELPRLMTDKVAFAWEAQTAQQVPRTRYDEAKRRKFLEMIRASERVSLFVKAKSDDEILAHYLFVKGDYLTNLGVLWIGERFDRATLREAPAIQFIKYDEREEKSNKITWDDFYLNPYELIEAVWREVPDWREFHELPDGIFRKTIPHYHERVIRELLANALAHRPYTQGGDIFLKLYPNPLEVHNPGRLPPGVTPRNILHASFSRNANFAQVCRDLGLMEKEGSGYDMLYDLLLSNGKRVPEVSEGHDNDRVVVTIYKNIVNQDIVEFVAKAQETFNLTQKERVTLGLLAQREALTVSQLVKRLELKNAAEAKDWLGRLPDWGLVEKKGYGKGTQYFVAPELLRRLNFKGPTSLKNIQRHRLRALILQDLEIYHEASLGEIHHRIGPEIPRRAVQYELQLLLDEGEIGLRGSKRWAKYVYKQKPLE